MAYQYPLNGGRINASMAGNTANAGTLISTGTMYLSGGNNITLSQNGQSIGISGPNALTSQSNQALSGSNGSFAFQTASFSNANGVSFGTSAGSAIFGSVNTTYAGSNHSHGNPTLNLTNLSGTTASASNGLTLSLSAAAQSNQSLSFSAGSQSTLTATGTFDARSLYINGVGGISAGFSQSSIFLSAHSTYAPSNHSHGNPTLNLTNLSGTTASASNGLTLSLSAAAPGAGAAISAAGASASNGTVVFSNSNGVGFGMNGSTVTASHNGLTSQSNQALSAGNGSFAFQTASFSNANGISFSTSAGSAIVASHNALTSQSNQAASASNGSFAYQTLGFSNANNVTFGTSAGSIITASINPGAGGGVAMANSETTYTSGTVNLVGDGQVSVYSAANQSYRISIPGTSSMSAVAPFGMTTNGATVSMGVGAFTAYAGSNTFSSSSGTVNASSMRFVGSGNVSVGVVNGSVMVSGGGGGGGIAIRDGANTISTGTASILANGGLTASINGQTLSLNAPAVSSLTGTGAISIVTNASTISIGAPAVSSLSATGAVSLSSNGNTISIGVPMFSAGVSNTAAGGSTSGNMAISNTGRLALYAGTNIGLSQVTAAGGNASVTIQAAAGGGGGGGTATMWYPYNEAINVMGQMGQGSLGFAPVPTPSVGEVLHVDRLVYPLHFSNSSNSTGSLTVSLWMGLYTRTLSSISLAHSHSTSVSLAYAGNNSSASQRGIRLLSAGWTTTIPDGRYVVGIVSRSTTAGANATLSQVQISQMNTHVSGMWNAASNATVQWPLGIGIYSATTSGLPASVAYSQIQGTNSLAARPPSWHMISGTA